MFKIFTFIAIFSSYNLVFAENKACPQLKLLSIPNELVSDRVTYATDDIFNELLVVPAKIATEVIPEMAPLCSEIASLNSVFPMFSHAKFDLRIWPHNDRSGSENDWGIWVFKLP